MDPFHPNPCENVTAPPPKDTDYIEMTYLAVAFVIGGPLNLVALTKLAERRRAKGMSRLLLLKFHLNVTDLLVIFVYTSSRFCWLVTYEWRGGAILCPLVLYLHSVSFYVSSYVIICIALDRVGTTMWPRWHTGKAGRLHVRLLLIASWTFALLVALPQFAIWRAYRPFSHLRFTQCITIWHIQRFQSVCNPATRNMSDDPEPLMQTYFAMHITLTFWFPAVVVVVSYAWILVWVCVQLRMLRKSPCIRLRSSDASDCENWDVRKSIDGVRRSTLLTCPPLMNSDVYTDSGLKWPEHRVRLSSGEMSMLRNHSDPAVAFFARAKRRIMCSTLLLVFAYIACWLPYNIMSLIELLDPALYRNVEKEYFFLYGLIVFNSVINPLIYGGVVSFPCFKKKSMQTPQVVIEAPQL